VIVDTSAIVAIFFDEPERPLYSRLIQDADICRMSIANYLELSIVLRRQATADDVQRADGFFQRANITLEPVTLDQGFLARQAFLDFGKGRHPAGLNFGDCFAYALAKSYREPLLFKGQDFAQTDVRAAVL
jgi:ribonuclease VapC